MGLYQRSPAVALLLLIFMLSLAGIPPTAGFMAKYFIFQALIESHHPVLAVFAALYIVPALYYYFRVVVHAWMKKPGEAPAPHMSSAQAVAAGRGPVRNARGGIYPEPFARLRAMPSDHNEKRDEQLTPAEKQAKGFSQQFAMAMELPFVLVAAVAVGGLIGYFLDRWLHTKPVLMLSWAFWGSSAACAMCCGVFPQTTMESPSIDISRYLASERRISWLTLLSGALAALPVGYFHGWRWGSGILIGAALAWLNFRWLKEGLDALTEAATAQAERPKARCPWAPIFARCFATC